MPTPNFLRRFIQIPRLDLVLDNRSWGGFELVLKEPCDVFKKINSAVSGLGTGSSGEKALDFETLLPEVKKWRPFFTASHLDQEISSHFRYLYWAYDRDTANTLGGLLYNSFYNRL